MALRNFAVLIFSLSITTAVWADSLKINPNHPDKYTVVKGDTLWDISAKFLQNPWEWPKLWKNNPQIKNPHLIYPGDTLYFSIVNGQPQLSLTPANQDMGFSPRVRQSPVEDAIEMIPSDAIRQFLTSPKVVSEHELEKAPYVIDFAGEHLLAGAGDRIYVRAITHPESLSYIIYRKGKTYISPDTHKVLGYEASYIADATLQSVGDPATLSINKSDQEIRMGDRLMVNSAGELALNYYPHIPSNQIKGSIISVLNGVSQIGQYNVVVIDKGTADGVETGHVFDIYRKGRLVVDRIGNPDKADSVKLPDEIAGALMVFRPFEQVSYALVMEASSAIHVLDRIETPVN
jgi:hypothetical protein